MAEGVDSNPRTVTRTSLQIRLQTLVTISSSGMSALPLKADILSVSASMPAKCY